MSKDLVRGRSGALIPRPWAWKNKEPGSCDAALWYSIPSTGRDWCKRRATRTARGGTVKLCTQHYNHGRRWRIDVAIVNGPAVKVGELDPS